MKLLRIILILVISCNWMLAQSEVELKDWAIEVMLDGVLLESPLTGGMNSPQFSSVDLNDDGLEDLYVFDREGNVHLTFLYDGMTYRHAPAYEANFPSLRNWVLLRDYNGDGVSDIFTYSTIPGVDGVEVYRGFYEAGKIAFEQYAFPNEQMFNLIYFPLSNEVRTQLYVLKIDYPAVDDIDGDGDLDLLTFSTSGGNVEYFQNQSVERGYGLDSLIFEQASTCWGGFFEDEFQTEIKLAEQAGDCAERLLAIEPRHVGSTLATLDVDDDCDKELIIGDIFIKRLFLLNNGGSCSDAWMNTQDVDFPSYDTPAEVDEFPATFYLDVNQDGFKDLLIAPNEAKGGTDLNMIWYYENTQADEGERFALQDKNFLVDQMLDFGSGASPVFVDYNADGLLDLLVGNSGYMQRTADPRSQLFLLENIGTATSPKFDLVDDNFLNFRQFFGRTSHFAPTFGDLDDDGDLDLLVGDERGRLYFAENIAETDMPMVFGAIQGNYMRIDVGTEATPLIKDLNEDGLLDLLIGERNGNLNYFENIGTKSDPMFADAPTSNFFGNIDTRDIGNSVGASAPTSFRAEDQDWLLTGTEAGQLEFYPFASDVVSPLDLTSLALSEQTQGVRTRAAIADLNSDGFLDVVVGNERGGIRFYHTDIAKHINVSSIEELPATLLQIYPNPAKSEVVINLPLTSDWKTIRILDLTGKQVDEKTINNTTANLSISNFPAGVYWIQASSATQLVYQKLVVQ